MIITSTVIITRLKADRVNLQPNAMTAGLPAMTALTGFAHHLCLRLQESGVEPTGLEETALLIHDLHCNEGHARFHPGKYRGRDATATSRATASTIDVLEGSMEFSLAIRFEHASPEGGHGRIITTSVQNALLRMRFAGGGLRTTEQTRVLVLDDVDRTDVLSRLRQEVHTGWLFLDAAEEEVLPAMRKAGKTCLDLDLLADLISRPRGHAGSTEGPPPDQPWAGNDKPSERYLAPLAVGYRAVEKPTSRMTPRGNMPHAYAEPLVGVGRIIGLEDLTRAEMTRARCWWRYDLESQVRGLFTVTARNADSVDRMEQ
jgi:CRISPR type I-F-associated protein Csy2